MPVETIVIIAIAVLVLVVIVAFFVGGAGTQVSTIEDRNALTSGCVQLSTAYGCSPDKNLKEIVIMGYNVDADNDGAKGTLADACMRNGFSVAECRTIACRCPAP